MGEAMQEERDLSDRLIDSLLEARRTRASVDIEAQPELRPATLDAAYAAQARHLARYLAEKGGRQTGYKLGATSHATMQALGFEAPFHGPVADVWTHQSPAVLPRGDFFVCAIELEVGVRLGADLPSPDIDMAQLRAAIADAFPVLEIADTRFVPGKPPGPAAIVADLGNAGALVVGRPCESWRALDLDDLPVRLLDGDTVVAEGGGALVVDGPLGQLLNFARRRAAAGQPLRAGDLVSTGSCIPPYPAKAGQRLMGQLGKFGEVSLTLT